MFGGVFHGVQWYLKNFKGNFREVSNVFQGCFKEVSRVFEGGWKGVSMEF